MLPALTIDALLVNVGKFTAPPLRMVSEAPAMLLNALMPANVMVVAAPSEMIEPALSNGLAAPVVRFSTPPLLANNAPTLLNVAPPEIVMVLLPVARMTPVAALLMLDVAERPVRLIADVPVAVMVPALL